MKNGGHVNPQVVQSEKGRPMLLSICSDCNFEMSEFLTS